MVAVVEPKLQPVEEAPQDIIAAKDEDVQPKDPMDTTTAAADKKEEMDGQALSMRKADDKPGAEAPINEVTQPADETKEDGKVEEESPEPRDQEEPHAEEEDGDARESTGKQVKADEALPGKSRKAGKAFWWNERKERALSAATRLLEVLKQLEGVEVPKAARPLEELRLLLLSWKEQPLAKAVNATLKQKSFADFQLQAKKAAKPLACLGHDIRQRLQVVLLLSGVACWADIDTSAIMFRKVASNEAVTYLQSLGYEAKQAHRMVETAKAKAKLARAAALRRPKVKPAVRCMQLSMKLKTHLRLLQQLRRRGAPPAWRRLYEKLRFGKAQAEQPATAEADEPGSADAPSSAPDQPDSAPHIRVRIQYGAGKAEHLNLLASPEATIEEVLETCLHLLGTSANLGGMLLTTAGGQTPQTSRLKELPVPPGPFTLRLGVLAQRVGGMLCCSSKQAVNASAPSGPSSSSSSAVRTLAQQCETRPAEVIPLLSSQDGAQDLEAQSSTEHPKPESAATAVQLAEVTRDKEGPGEEAVAQEQEPEEPVEVTWWEWLSGALMFSAEREEEEVTWWKYLMIGEGVELYWAIVVLLAIVCLLGMARALWALLHDDPVGPFKVAMPNVTQMFEYIKHGNTSGPAFMEMPPVLPNLGKLSVQDQAWRSLYWVTYMTLELLLTNVLGTIVMMAPPLGCGGDRMAELTSAHWDLLTTVILSAFMTLAVTATIRAGSQDHLNSKTGFAWEYYHFFLAIGEVGALSQAVLLRLLFRPRARFGVTAFAVAQIGMLVPFAADPFDSLKDALFAATALCHPNMGCKVLGALAFANLIIMHGLMISDKSLRLELRSSYLSILCVRPVAEGYPPAEEKEIGWCECIVIKALPKVYMQVRPSRQRSLVLEDFPQGLLAVIFSLYLVALGEKASPMVIVLNIAVPALRYVFARTFFRPLGHALKQWMLEQLVATHVAGQKDQFTEYAHELAVLEKTSRSSIDGMVEQLLGKFEPIGDCGPLDATNTEGETALMRASRDGHDDVARCLLEAGADPSIKNQHGPVSRNPKHHVFLASNAFWSLPFLSVLNFGLHVAAVLAMLDARGWLGHAAAYVLIIKCVVNCCVAVVNRRCAPSFVKERRSGNPLTDQFFMTLALADSQNSAEFLSACSDSFDDKVLLNCGRMQLRRWGGYVQALEDLLLLPLMVLFLMEGENTVVMLSCIVTTIVLVSQAGRPFIFWMSWDLLALDLETTERKADQDGRPLRAEMSIMQWFLMLLNIAVFVWDAYLLAQAKPGARFGKVFFVTFTVVGTLMVLCFLQGAKDKFWHVMVWPSSQSWLLGSSVVFYPLLLKVMFPPAAIKESFIAKMGMETLPCLRYVTMVVLAVVQGWTADAARNSSLSTGLAVGANGYLAIAFLMPAFSRATSPAEERPLVVAESYKVTVEELKAELIAKMPEEALQACKAMALC